MNIDTVLDNILNRCLAGSKGSIKLKESSSLWELLCNYPKTDSDLNNGFNIGDSLKNRYKAALYGKHQFPFAYFLFLTTIYLIRILIKSFYCLASFIKQVLTGKKSDLSQSPRFNFIVFVATCTFYLILIVTILIFFVKSVLLFRPDTRINEYGAITMPQSCERENYMYLLNTASYWDNSGIKVSAGDIVSITVSGSFFSDIDDMYTSALYNKKTTYARSYVSFDRNRESQIDNSSHSRLLVTNLKNGKHVNDRFGSLLIQIRDASQHNPYHQDDIIFDSRNNKSDNAYHFKAKKSGYLYFTVNDEYIDETWFNRIKSEPRWLDSLEIENYAKLDIDKYNALSDAKKASLKGVISGNYVYLTQEGYNLIKDNKEYQNSIGINADSLEKLIVWDKWNEDLAKMWYSDNVGDILINVKIVRSNVQCSIFEPSVLSKTYRKVEDFFLSPTFWHREIWHLAFIILIIFCLMALDRKFGKKSLMLLKKPYLKVLGYYNRLLNHSQVLEKNKKTNSTKKKRMT